MYCEDCGTKLSSGRCPNCHEESYIFHEQNEFVERVSEDFMNKVAEQDLKRVSPSEELLCK